MDVKQIIIASLLGYFIGCIQTAYIIGRALQNIDIRLYGSNNAGASNVTRVMGWKYGILTALVDILKGTAAVIIAVRLFPGQHTLHFLTGALVVIGHIFPFYLGFRGGKGTASLIGISLAINFKIALIIGLALIIITLVTDYIALGSLAMYTLFPVATYLFNYGLACIIIVGFLCLIGYFKHFINIKRLLAKEEVGLRQVARRKS